MHTRPALSHIKISLTHTYIYTLHSQSKHHEYKNVIDPIKNRFK